MKLCFFFSLSSYQISNFVIGLYFLSVVNKFGISSVYLGFSAVCVLAVLYIAGNVVETKGRSLEEIERALSSPSTWRNFPEVHAVIMLLFELFFSFVLLLLVYSTGLPFLLARVCSLAYMFIVTKFCWFGKCGNNIVWALVKHSVPLFPQLLSQCMFCSARYQQGLSHFNWENFYLQNWEIIFSSFLWCVIKGNVYTNCFAFLSFWKE